jgi:outer membrane beta-barrel protein
MENWIRIFLLKTCLPVVALSLLSPLALAADPKPEDAEQPVEQVVVPEIERRDVRPPSIDAQDFEVGLFGGVMSVEDFGVNSIVGARLSYHVTDKFFVEGAYGRTSTEETSYELLSGSATLIEDGDRDYSYYSVSLGYHIFPGEAFWGKKRAFNSSFYLTLGAGSTEFAGDSFFTVIAGAGYRMLLNDALAIHFDFRDHLFDSDILGEEKTVQNLESSLGLSLFF